MANEMGPRLLLGLPVLEDSLEESLVTGDIASTLAGPSTRLLAPLQGGGTSFSSHDSSLTSKMGVTFGMLTNLPL